MSATLPDGWTAERVFSGRPGDDVRLYDDAGEYVGSYGWVRDSYREDANPGHWQTGGRTMPSVQACIDHLSTWRQR